MAALETRLLVLGAVATFEPVNGYQIRRELLSWNVEEWAHIKPGSIYSSLSTLTGQGVLDRHELEDGGRTVAVYTVTDDGRAELERLFSVALEKVDLLAPLAFQTALTLIPLIDRQTFLVLARRRLASFRELDIVEGEMPDGAETAPPHIPAVFDLWTRVGVAERGWLEDFIARVEAGEFAFAGESSDWSPPADDPGWQMAIDRERYARMLGRS